MDPILEPLTFPEKDGPTMSDNEMQLVTTECPLCPDVFNIQNEGNDKILAHLLIKHKLVIADLKEIANFESYINYWRTKLKNADLKEYCFAMDTTNENGVIEQYYMLAHELPEDQNLRECLQREKLVLVIRQQQTERRNENFTHGCLFCQKTFTGNRKVLLEHMNLAHNFSVGLPDNIVFVEEYLKLLNEKLTKNICLYCAKVFKDRNVLKEHMRKKQHKKINPLDKEFDKFYLVNYLEPGKNWKDIMEEIDEICPNEDWSDWYEPETEAICLFCDFQASEPEKMALHISSHNFDFQNLKKKFSIYQQIKIVNYIRRQIHEKKCILCDLKCESKDEVNAHMQNSNHFSLPNNSVWDQSQYYFPTYENDALLCSLDDTKSLDGVSEGDQVPIIPEESDINFALVKEELMRHELIK